MSTYKTLFCFFSTFSISLFSFHPQECAWCFSLRSWNHVRPTKYKQGQAWRPSADTDLRTLKSRPISQLQWWLLVASATAGAGVGGWLDLRSLRAVKATCKTFFMKRVSSVHTCLYCLPLSLQLCLLTSILHSDEADPLKVTGVLFAKITTFLVFTSPEPLWGWCHSANTHKYSWGFSLLSPHLAMLANSSTNELGPQFVFYFIFETGSHWDIRLGLDITL